MNRRACRRIALGAAMVLGELGDLRAVPIIAEIVKDTSPDNFREGPIAGKFLQLRRSRNWRQVDTAMFLQKRLQRFLAGLWQTCRH